jgi:hypothetical protein
MAAWAGMIADATCEVSAALAADMIMDLTGREHVRADTTT